MNNKQGTVKNLIKYLTEVSNGEKIEGLSQSFFISNKELDKILREYFIFFKNEKELLSDVRYNYNLIKGLSFLDDKNNYTYAKDLSIENTVSYSKEQHNGYSHRIHSHLIKAFEGKLGLKNQNKPKRITVKNKRIIEVVERLNLEVEFLKEDCTPKEFIDVLIGKSEKDIYLNITNRDFHYLLTKIKDYFFNFSITAVADTNKIHSKKGTLLASKNLRNSKVDSPRLKREIDGILINFR